MLTAGVDIQQDGIYYEVVAWGDGKRSWSMYIGGLAILAIWKGKLRILPLAFGTSWMKSMSSVIPMNMVITGRLTQWRWIVAITAIASIYGQGRQNQPKAVC